MFSQRDNKHQELSLTPGIPDVVSHVPNKIYTDSDWGRDTPQQQKTPVFLRGLLTGCYQLIFSNQYFTPIQQGY